MIPLCPVHLKVIQRVHLIRCYHLMLIGGLLIVLFAGWKLGKAAVFDELTNGGTHPVLKTEIVMTTLEAIKARHSVRKYSDKPIESAKVETLRANLSTFSAHTPASWRPHTAPGPRQTAGPIRDSIPFGGPRTGTSVRPIHASVAIRPGPPGEWA